MVPRPEQGADNGGRHRRRCRLGLQAPVDDMGGTGELQREQQHRPWHEEPPNSNHCVFRGCRRKREKTRHVYVRARVLHLLYPSLNKHSDAALYSFCPSMLYAGSNRSGFSRLDASKICLPYQISFMNTVHCTWCSIPCAVQTCSDFFRQRVVALAILGQNNSWKLM